jgi:hypothetical protein
MKKRYMKNPCWKGFRAYGTKMKNGKEVPNCVPVEEELGRNNEWGRPEFTRKLLAATPGQEMADVPANLNKKKLKMFKDFVMEEAPAWQRKEGKSESGGLNRKGIASYRRENPGSKLSMAVTTEPSKLKKGSKAWKRRKSFCKRMSGMKRRLTSTKTANDPDSRINKALRKWNC